MSALKSAFEAVGYKSADERLYDIAINILRRHPRDWHAQKTMRLWARPRLDPQFLDLWECAVEAFRENGGNWDQAREALFKAVRNDAGLLWALFEPYHHEAAHKLLTEVSEKAHRYQIQKRAEEAAESERDRLRSTNQSDGRRQISVAAPSGSGLANGENQIGHARPAASPSPQKVTAAPRDPVVAAKMMANVIRLSLLDTFKVELTGQGGSKVVPLGDCRASEAKSWAGLRERDVRFIRLLTDNLPDDQPIRRYRSAEDVEKIYAEANHAAQ